MDGIEGNSVEKYCEDFVPSLTANGEYQTPKRNENDAQSAAISNTTSASNNTARFNGRGHLIKF
jgi:hypothetical protein